MSLKPLRLAPFLFLFTLAAQAQSPADLPALQGLAPVTILATTPAGQSTLDANYTVTGGIQTGAITQPTLLPFPEQQQLALRDVFSATKNLADLADGLGTTLAAAYTARAHNIDSSHFTSASPSIAALIAYACATTSADSGAGKYLFANATTDGKKPVSPQVAQILKAPGATTDPFGHAYHHLAGTPGNDKYGDSRPFQTEPSLTKIVGPDYFNELADNIVYNRGPKMDLTNSPSYPSGHTTYGYTGSLLLAILVPQRYQQMIARGAEYGNDRIIVGAHYAMDVLGGRTLALYDVAHLLANDPNYVGQTFKAVPPITDFAAAVKAARTELKPILELACNDTVERCAQQDIGRFSHPKSNEAFYNATQTYDLGVAFPEIGSRPATEHEDVFKLAPEAGNLLTIVLPSLTLQEADKILTETEGPGGGFLDNGSAFGVYSRLNLYAAYARAQQFVAAK